MSSPSRRGRAFPPVRVSPGTLVTVVVLAVVVHLTASTRITDPVAAVAVSVGVALAMIASVLVHELAHAVAARALGARVDHVALTLWGGHTQYRGDHITARGSVLVSLVGPVSNLVIAGLASLAAPLAGPDALGLFWSLCATLNLALAVFNLLPGLPMDGGRAVEAVLGGVLGSRTRGTRITAWIGRGIAVTVVLVPLVGLLGGNDRGTGGLLVLVWAVMIAGMLWQGASGALEGARVQDRVEALDARELLQPVAVLDARSSVAEVEHALAPGAPVLAVPGPPGPGAAPGTPRLLRPDPAALASVPPAARASTPLTAVSSDLGTVPEIDADLRGDALVAVMLDRPAPAYLVRGADGGLLGVIISAHVQERLRGR